MRRGRNVIADSVGGSLRSPRMESGPALAGEKVGLRSWRDADVDFVLSVCDDPLIPLISDVPAEPSLAGALAFVEAQVARRAESRGWAWAIVPPLGEAAVGYVGALWISPPAGRASIGYWTRAAARRNGYTVDAVRTAADWLLTQGQVARLEAFIEPGNTASVAVAEQAGFQREGLMRSFAPLGDTRRDAYLYARIAD